MADLEVFLVTPVREVWSGAATMVIARGTEGEVGILAGHAPMLIRLAIGRLRIQHDGQEQQAFIDGGFLHVVSDEGKTRVDVLADAAELQEEVDFDAAERARSEAEARAREGDEAAKADVARAEARLSLRA